MKRFPIKRTISLSLLLSLLIHGVIGLVLVYENADSIRALTQPPQRTEVELVDVQKLLEAQRLERKLVKKEELLRGQIVQQDEKQLNDEVPVDSRFLSAHNQVVKEQTQAAANGKFKNSADSSGEKTQERVIGKTERAEQREQKEQKAESEQKELAAANDGDVELSRKTSKLKSFMPSFRPTAPEVQARDVAKGGGEGPSATDDHLKDVKTGMQTLLSTREFLYYSYYNRIRSKLSQYWQPMIREKMERIMKQGRTIASTGDKITKIVIILDGQGVLRKVQVLGTAGVRDLDDAAIEAFRAAAPFPNPPKGMVDQDGEIKIRWDFVLEA